MREDMPQMVRAALIKHGVTVVDEVSLRVELERRLSSYTLYRLTPAASRRWNCKYRLMFGATYIDCQTVAEAYARALLAVVSAP